MYQRTKGIGTRVRQFINENILDIWGEDLVESEQVEACFNLRFGVGILGSMFKLER